MKVPLPVSERISGRASIQETTVLSSHHDVLWLVETFLPQDRQVQAQKRTVFCKDTGILLV